MASWNLPADHPDDTADWAHTLATDYLQRRGCDPTCQALGALLSADFARDAARGDRDLGPRHHQLHTKHLVPLRLPRRMFATLHSEPTEALTTTPRTA